MIEISRRELQRVAEEAVNESMRACKKHGPMSRRGPYVAQLPNEVHHTEIARAIRSAGALALQANEQGDWSAATILLEEVGEAMEARSNIELRRELIQVAAMALSWVVALRNPYVDPSGRPLDTCKHPGREPGEVCGACGELDLPEGCPEGCSLTSLCPHCMGCKHDSGCAFCKPDRPEDPEYCPECGREITWSDNGRCDACEDFDPDGEDGFDIYEEG